MSGVTATPLEWNFLGVVLTATGVVLSEYGSGVLVTADLGDRLLDLGFFGRGASKDELALSTKCNSPQFAEM